MKTIIKLSLLFLLVISTYSCKNNIVRDKEQPVVLTDSCEFDLSKITFKENIPLLFSEFLSRELKEYQSNEIDTAELAYYPYNYKQFMVEVPPAHKFGYYYRSSIGNRVACFDSIYFESLEVLTDLDTTAVAFLASVDIEDRALAKRIIQKIKESYGTCSYACYIRGDEDHVSYEWIVNGYYLQIETDLAISQTISTLSPGIEIKEYMAISIFLVPVEYAYTLRDISIVEVQGQKIYTSEKFTLNSINPRILDSAVQFEGIRDEEEGIAQSYD